MLINYSIDMSVEDMKEVLEKGGMAYKKDWETLEGKEMVHMMESVDVNGLNEGTVNEMLEYWFGMWKEDLEIFIEYDVKLEEGLMSLEMISFNTYIVGFKQEVEFDVNKWDREVESVVNEWHTPFMIDFERGEWY